MLSIEECRKLIDNEAELTDEQIVELRDAMYNLANLALDAYFQEKRKIGTEIAQNEELCDDSI